MASKAIPGTLTAKEARDGGWRIDWISPRGTHHMPPGRYPTKAKAEAAGRAWVRGHMAEVAAQHSDDSGVVEP